MADTGAVETKKGDAGLFKRTKRANLLEIKAMFVEVQIISRSSIPLENKQQERIR